MKYIIKEYKKIYCSTILKDEKVVFGINFKINYLEDLIFAKDHKDLTIEMGIHYLYKINKNGLYGSEIKSYNNWKLATFSSSFVSLQSSIMIHPEYRSYGIGKFALNELFKIANMYVPKYSLKGYLAPVDSGPDNVIRRDKLYSKIGFKVSGTSLTIDKIRNLKNLDKEINYIEEIDCFSKLEILKKENIAVVSNYDNQSDSLEWSRKQSNNYKIENRRLLFSILRYRIILLLLCFGVYFYI